MNNQKDFKRLIDLIAAHGLELCLNQDRHGYRVETDQGRLLTPILSAPQMKIALESMLNAVNELALINKYRITADDKSIAFPYFWNK